MESATATELNRAALRVASFFRLGQNGEGHEALSQFVDALGRHMTAELAASALPVLEQVLSAQLKGDFLFLADLLEHGITKVFENNQQITHLSE